MNLGRAFTFAFEDKDWLKKLGIAGLVMLIPIIGQLTVSGWALETTRRVIHHEPEELADWGAFGDYLVKGLKIFVIGIVYALPIILISICANLPLMFLGEWRQSICDIRAQPALNLCQLPGCDLRHRPMVLDPGSAGQLRRQWRARRGVPVLRSIWPGAGGSGRVFAGSDRRHRGRRDRRVGRDPVRHRRYFHHCVRVCHPGPPVGPGLQRSHGQKRDVIGLNP